MHNIYWILSFLKRLSNAFVLLKNKSKAMQFSVFFLYDLYFPFSFVQIPLQSNPLPYAYYLHESFVY